MFIDSKQAENEALLAAAKRMCAAARTAPKTKGVDTILTAVLTNEDKDALADAMQRIGERDGVGFFLRDAQCVRACGAVVFVGSRRARAGLGKLCGLCGYASCADNAENGGMCAFNHVDAGIAAGSAVSVAADARVDSRIMFSAGKAALELGLLGDEAVFALGIPLSVSGKSPFFDRK